MSREPTGRVSEVKDDLGEVFAFTCDTHPDSRIEATEARVRTRGWGVFVGKSLTGEALSMVRCPVCTGRAAEDAAGRDGAPDAPFGWDAECDTCFASMWDDWGVEDMPDGGYTEEDAHEWGRDHRCEPSVTYRAPQ